jgi:hypothetical protein
MIRFSQILFDEEIENVRRLTMGRRLLDTPVLFLSLNDIITLYDNKVFATSPEEAPGISEVFEIITLRYTKKGDL